MHEISRHASLCAAQSFWWLAPCTRSPPLAAWTGAGRRDLTCGCIRFNCAWQVLLVGDSGVGKSCLLMRFTTDRFEDTTTSTIGDGSALQTSTDSGVPSPGRTAAWRSPAQQACR
jgi:hypothetical protein